MTLFLVLLVPVRRRSDTVPDPDRKPPTTDAADALQLDLTEPSQEARG
jgi:hypothetical protein